MRITRTLSWCECEGMIVLLDLAADRYFRLAPRLEPAFRRHVAGEGRDADRQVLVQAGLALEERLPGPGQLTEPSSDIRGDLRPAARAPLAGLTRALVAEAAAAWRLRYLGLGQALLAPPSPGRASRRDTEIVPGIAACFARTGLMFGVSDRCLTRAIACRAVCAALGIQVVIVLGVRASPFQAHAWIEHGVDVLVGDFDQVRAYTPILALA